MFNINENHFMKCGTPAGAFPPEKPRFTMTEEVEHTAREMRNTIDRLLKFEKRVEAKFDDLMKHLTSDNVLFKNTFAEGYNAFLMEVKNEVNAFESGVDAAVTLFQNNIETDYAHLSEDCKRQITEYTSGLTADFTELSEKCASDITTAHNEFTQQLNSYKEELNSTYDDFRTTTENRITQYNNAHVDAFNSYTSSVNSKLAAMEKKFNNDYKNFVNQVNTSISEFKVAWANTIEARLDMQDAKIEDANTYMRTNLNASLENLLYEMKEDGQLAGVIESELFTTPEMYGAAGDGESDDTAAFVAALATGKPVMGKAGHSYKISNLIVNGKISGCNFVSVGRNNDGIILQSGAAIEKCGFSGFNNAIVAGSANIVAATIRDCLMQYCTNGIYLNMANGYSVNKLIVENNYFVKHGDNADNMNAQPSAENGYGLFIGGNICGAHIYGNVFEYNTRAGIGVACDNTAYRLGVFIHDNYFEGNKHSAIYLNVTTRTAHQISVISNFYSVLSTNVFVTNRIYVEGAISSVYDIADDNAIQCCSQYTDAKTHKTTLNADNCNSIYVQLSPVKYGIEHLRFVYRATLNSNIEFKDSSGGLLFTLESGVHTVTIPYGTSFVLGRIPAEGESIELLHFGS